MSKPKNPTHFCIGLIINYKKFIFCWNLLHKPKSISTFPMNFGVSAFWALRFREKPKLNPSKAVRKNFLMSLKFILLKIYDYQLLKVIQSAVIVKSFSLYLTKIKKVEDYENYHSNYNFKYRFLIFTKCKPKKLFWESIREPRLWVSESFLWREVKWKWFPFMN